LSAPADFESAAREGVAAIKETREFEVLAKAAALSPWERLLWLVFGEGASLLFLVVAMSLGNLFFLDVAFSQVERVRNVARYVIARRGQFPSTLVEGLSRLRFVREGNVEGLAHVAPEIPEAAGEPVALGGDASESVSGLILGHHKEREATREGPLWKRLLAPRLVRGSARMWGFVFRFAEGPAARGWELKYFALPLPLVVAAVATLAGIGFSAGDAEGLYDRLRALSWLPLAASGGVVAFVLLCVVAFQGGLVVYMRLPPLLLLLVLAVVLIIAASGLLTPLVVIAFLGALGLLDYAYDLRGRAHREPTMPLR
jgi:hypothetical protein